MATRRIYYGWTLVVALAVAETTSWGVLFYAFSVFVKPMEADLGWSRASVTGAFSVSLLVSGIASVPAGRWLDRHGPRAMMTAGSCAAVLLVLAWAAVDRLAIFYLVWAAIGVTTAMVLYQPALWVVASWFRRKRGRALTVLTFIAGFASVIYLPLSGYLVEALGWREALVVLAGILAAGTIPIHALVLRRRPADLGLLPDGRSPEAEALDPGPMERSLTVSAALHGQTFWLLAAAFFLSALMLASMVVHLVPYLTDQGHSAGFAAAVAGSVGVMALPGRLVLTPLGDHLPRSLVTAGIFILQAVAVLALMVVPGTPGAIIYVVLFGAGFGAITPARAALLADYFGPGHYGAIAGIMALCLTPGAAFAPVGAGLAHDLSGSYDVVLVALVVTSILGAVAVLFAERAAQRAIAAAPGGE